MVLGNVYFVSGSPGDTDVQPGLKIIVLFDITGKSVFHGNRYLNMTLKTLKHHLNKINKSW